MFISRETVIIMDWYASLAITVIRDYGEVLSVLYSVDVKSFLHMSGCNIPLKT